MTTATAEAGQEQQTTATEATPQDAPLTTTATEAKPADERAELDAFEELSRKHGFKDDEPDPSVTEPDAIGADGAGDQTSGEDEESADEAEAPDKTQDGKDADAKQEQGEGQTEAQTEAIDEAIEALRVDGYDDDAIEALFKADRDAFIQIGKKRRKLQGETKTYINSLRQGTAGQQKAKEGDGATDGPAGPDKRKSPSVDQAIKETIDQTLDGLKDTEIFLDDEAGKQLFSVGLSTLAEKLTEAYEARLGAVSQQNEAMARSFEDLRVERLNDRLENTRKTLAEKYPAIETQDVYDRVLEKYDALAETNQYTEPETALRDAAKLVLGDEAEQANAKTLREKLLTTASKQRKGTPRATSTPSGDQKMSDEDREFLDYLKIDRRHYGKKSG